MLERLPAAAEGRASCWREASSMARSNPLGRGVFVWPKCKKDGKKTIYGIRFTDAQGEEVKERVGPNAEEARRRYARRKDDVEKEKSERAAGLERPGGAWTFADASRAFRHGAGANHAGRKNFPGHESVWLAALGDIELQAIRPSAVEEAANRWLGAGFSNGTVTHRLNYLSRVWGIAVRDGRIDAENPVKIVKRPRKTPGRLRYLEWEEEDQLRLVFDPRWWHLVEFAVLTGLRQEEQFGLRWSSVDFNAQAIRVPRSKNGEARAVPMHPRVLEILRGMTSRMRSEYVFLGPRGGPLDPHNFCEDHFIPALEKAGICETRPRPKRRKDGEERPVNDVRTPRKRREFTWHDLRHTFASRLVMAGRDLYEVMRLLGHRDLESTQIYAHLSPRYLRDAINSLPVRPIPSLSENASEKTQPQTQQSQ